MKIAVRLDDITPDMNWQKFYVFKELLDRYNIKPLIGVVPDNKDKTLDYNELNEENGPSDFWEYINSLKKEGWVVAMHGYQHIYTTKKSGFFPIYNLSEFAGVDYEKQLKMLSSGKELLCDKNIITDIFMAPGHTFDKNTLKVLKELGILRVTDGYGFCPYIYKGITFYPISFYTGMEIRKRKGATSMVVHTNTITYEALSWYENFFKNPGRIEWISYQEYLRIPPRSRFVLGRTCEYILARMKSLYK